MYPLIEAVRTEKSISDKRSAFSLLIWKHMPQMITIMWHWFEPHKKSWRCTGRAKISCMSSNHHSSAAVQDMAQWMPLPLTVSCFNEMWIGLPFWCRITRVVLDKGPLNGCVCVLYHRTCIKIATSNPLDYFQWSHTRLTALFRDYPGEPVPVR